MGIVGKKGERMGELGINSSYRADSSTLKIQGPSVK